MHRHRRQYWGQQKSSFCWKQKWNGSIFVYEVVLTFIEIMLFLPKRQKWNLSGTQYGFSFARTLNWTQFKKKNYTQRSVFERRAHHIFAYFTWRQFHLFASTSRPNRPIRTYILKSKQFNILSCMMYSILIDRFSMGSSFYFSVSQNVGMRFLSKIEEIRLFVRFPRYFSLLFPNWSRLKIEPAISARFVTSFHMNALLNSFQAAYARVVCVPAILCHGYESPEVSAVRQSAH